MKTGQQQIEDVANEIKQLAQSNPCGMSDGVMAAIAGAIRDLVTHSVAKELSADSAAAYLGVSVRTLRRLVESGKIAPPRRKGFRSKAYDKADLDRYMSAIQR